MTSPAAAQPDGDPGHGVAVLRLARSWTPTALGSSLLAWEIPLVVAVVGRMAQGTQAMAALGAGLAVLVVVNSPALALAPLVVAEIHSRGPRALSRQAAITGVTGCAALVALAALPGVSAAFPAVLGLPTELRADFRLCLLAFATAPLAVAVRRRFHGRLIAANATGPIATATAVRIAVTVMAALVERWAAFPSAAVGGVALSCGAWAEAGLLVRGCRGVSETGPVSLGPPGSGLVAQHARMTSVVLLNMSPALVTTVVIAWSHQASASLIVWPALYGLLSLGTVPLSDVDSVGAAFLRRGGPPPVLRRFVVLLGGGLLTIALLVALTPLARLYLENFSGVPREPAELGLRWCLPVVLAPTLWALRGRLRAVAIAGGSAGALPRAAAVHLAVLLGVGAALPFTTLPGVACASVAVVAALVGETVALQAAGRGAGGEDRQVRGEGDRLEAPSEPGRP
ncbi:MAG TPA: hypothetical protein VI248_13915 [Kineosporiaceae bacterium]